MSSNQLVMRIEVIEKQIADMMEEKYIQKINSQEKEIEFLKKNALAQELKINTLERLVNKWIITRHEQNGYGRVPPNVSYMGGELDKNQVTICRELEAYRLQLFANEANLIIAAKYTAEKNERDKIEAAAEKKKQEEDKANAEKAMKDMMDRVALLEETAKKEELELENLKLVSDTDKSEMKEAIEITEMAKLLVREANALARAAEMRSEKAKLRGKQKNRASSSNDPTTWSKEKAETISKMWCE